MPHPHTSEAHHTTLINTHPKLFSQPSSAHIRSSSLNPHQHTSEALLSSHTKQSPKLRISINQSISQPIRPTIFFHNYNPKYSKNKFKYYTKTPHPIQNSLYPLTTNRQKLTPPTSNAAPMPYHLPANHHTSHPQKPERTDCQRDGCMVGTRCVGVSRWSYLAPEAPGGKVGLSH